MGVVNHENNWVINYVEKPTYHFSVSTGIYIFEPEILEYIHPSIHLDLPDLVLKLIQINKKVNVFPFDGYWLDIGRPDDYETAMLQFSENRDKFLPINN